MTTVFLSGSRGISQLNSQIRDRIKTMMDKKFRLIIGDANGADKTLQSFLAESGYSDVIIYCSGQICRNNIGQWNVQNILVDSSQKGRNFYMQKDKEMAVKADYGFVLWNGKSAGSISNVIEMVERKKGVVVYLAPEKQFYSISDFSDFKEFINKCDKESIAGISKKLKVDDILRNFERVSQGVISF
jgi:hypothetical protein